MPCGGGDLGLNVWLENDELLCYLQRSGSFDENNEYLKLGRLRVRLDPNPFAADASFRQELKLREGYVEITAVQDDPSSPRQGSAVFQPPGARGKAPLPHTSDRTGLRGWTEVHRSVVHVEIESGQPVTVNAAYENWRQADEILPNDAGKSRSRSSFRRYPEMSYADAGGCATLVAHPRVRSPSSRRHRRTQGDCAGNTLPKPGLL